jgi:hypothetical protein
LANPFVLAVMNAFRGKLPKPRERKTEDDKQEARSSEQAPPGESGDRRDNAPKDGA